MGDLTLLCLVASCFASCHMVWCIPLQFSQRAHSLTGRFVLHHNVECMLTQLWSLRHGSEIIILIKLRTASQNVVSSIHLSWGCWHRRHTCLDQEGELRLTALTSLSTIVSASVGLDCRTTCIWIEEKRSVGNGHFLKSLQGQESARSHLQQFDVKNSTLMPR